MEDHRIADIDRAVVRHFGADPHQDNVAGLEVGILGKADEAGAPEVVLVQVLAALPELVAALEVEQLDPALLTIPITDERIAVENPERELPPDQRRSITAGLEVRPDLARDADD